MIIEEEFHERILPALYGREHTEIEPHIKVEMFYKYLKHLEADGIISTYYVTVYDINYLKSIFDIGK